MVETVKPSDCVAAPAPVKAGAALTISGKDMDLVTAVEFDNADALSGEAISVAADKVVVTAVPETATEGKLRLVMANGQKVEVDFTLVKPTATGYNANPASAGSTIQITGTDLDLVKSVDFGGAVATVEKDAVSADGTTLSIKLPMEAKTGTPVMKLANGVTVNAPALTVNEAVFCYATELPGADAELHAGQTFVLPIANGDKLTGVEIAGKACQFIVSGNTLTVGAPDNAKKGTSVRLISSNGEITYKIDFIPNTEITTVIWTGAVASGSWAKALTALSWGGYDWSQVSAGTELVVSFTAEPGATYCQMRFAKGNGWKALPGTTSLEGADKKEGNIAMPLDATEYRLTLTQEMLDELVNEGGLIICGANWIVTKVALVEHISVETTLWTGEAIADDWGKQPNLLSDGGAELKDAGASVGQTINFYITPTDTNWQLEIVEGHWGGTYARFSNPGNDDNGKFTACDLAANGGKVSLTLTQAMLDAAYKKQNWGGTFIANGDNVKITKITIE